MRGARSTLVLLVLFIALGAYVYFVELERAPASETPPNEQLVELESDDVTSLTIVTDGQETVLRRSGDQDRWEITSPISATADDTQVSSMTSALASLEIRRVISETAIDLEPFGLVEPVVELAFAGTESSERRLLIGDTTPTGGDRYAKLADSERVFLIAPHLNTTFGRSTFDLRDKTIVDFETADVDRFEIQSGDQTLMLTKSENEWRLTQPWEVRADFSTVEGTVGRLNSGQMRSVASEAPNTSGDDDPLAQYGLSEPRVVATVHLGSASATLLVGDEAPDGSYFAKDASRPMVFTVDSSLATDLERAASEYRDRNLFEFRPFNATGVEIEHAGETAEFEKDDATDGDTEDVWTRVTPEPTTVDRTAMDDLLAKLSNLRAESFVDSRSELGLDDSTVLATVRVRFDTGTAEGDGARQEHVTIWRSGEDTYGVHGEEPGAAVLDTRSVDDALEAVDVVRAASP